MSRRPARWPLEPRPARIRAGVRGLHIACRQEAQRRGSALEGWTLAIDASFDEDAPITIGGCKVDKFRVNPSQGGTVDLMFRIGSNDIDQDEAGWLCSHLAREIWITLTPPEKPAEAIDGTKGHPGASGAQPDAGELFAAEHGGQASKDALDATGNNHPDRGGSAERFDEVERAYRTWSHP